MSKVPEKVINRCDGCGTTFDAATDVASCTIVRGTMPPQPQNGKLCEDCWRTTGQSRPWPHAK